ncbi:MAG: hypothetical protein KJ646_00570 [Nanoarchaeota archaeon]|nr:hypothetical protein [Nanoarchaeota archaeon]
MAFTDKKQIIDYIKKNLKKGYDADSLKFALITQGYSRTMVKQALGQANKEIAETLPKLKEKPVIKYEILDKNDNPVKIKKPWWKRVFSW